MCKLFGVNFTIHDIHYSRHSKNSFRITEVGCVAECTGVFYMINTSHPVAT